MSGIPGSPELLTPDRIATECKRQVSVAQCSRESGKSCNKTIACSSGARAITEDIYLSYKMLTTLLWLVSTAFLGNHYRCHEGGCYASRQPICDASIARQAGQLAPHNRERQPLLTRCAKRALTLTSLAAHTPSSYPEYHGPR